MGPIDLYLVRYAYCFGGSKIVYLCYVCCDGNILDGYASGIMRLSDFEKDKAM